MLLSCIQYCSIYPFKRIFLSNCRCRWLLWFIFSLEGVDATIEKIPG